MLQAANILVSSIAASAKPSRLTRVRLRPIAEVAQCAELGPFNEPLVLDRTAQILVIWPVCESGRKTISKTDLQDLGVSIEDFCAIKGSRFYASADFCNRSHSDFSQAAKFDQTCTVAVCGTCLSLIE